MGNKVVLSARMRALTDMVTVGNRVCDVGCDHGWVSIYLVQQGISPRVLAMDVRQGPLSRAQEHIRQQGLEAYIETRLSDGVTALGIGEADTMICAGMGGRLMRRILEEGREKLQAMEELILQPQSEIPAFRAYLRQAGYVTLAEDMVYEDGKYYPMMKVAAENRCAVGLETGKPEQKTGSGMDIDILKAVERRAAAEGPAARGADSIRLQDCFGGLLLAGCHPVLRQYLLHERQSSQCILEQLKKNAAGGGRTMRRIRELEERQRLICLALEQYKVKGTCGTSDKPAKKVQEEILNSMSPESTLLHVRTP